MYELYAKMIGLVLTQFLLAPWRMPDGPAANHEASMFKIRNILQNFAKELMRSLPVWTDLLAVLSRLNKRLERLGFKQKRTKQPNICHALALASSLFALDIESDRVLELPTLLA